jgi:hypothetical protein
MSDEAFADLKEAMEDSLAFERGRRRDLKVTRVEAPRPPKLRSKLMIRSTIRRRKRQPLA